MCSYNNLKAELRRKGLRQQDLADVVHLKVAAINGKINGRYPFTLDEAFAIQEKLFPDCDIKYLFHCPKSAHPHNTTTAATKTGQGG